MLALFIFICIHTLPQHWHRMRVSCKYVFECVAVSYVYGMIVSPKFLIERVYDYLHYLPALSFPYYIPCFTVYQSAWE